MSGPIQALVVGRVGADIYPNELRTPLSEIRTFTRFLGGFAGNVSVGLARLGISTAILTRIGPDGHGEFCRRFLQQEGVDTSWVGTDPIYRTSLAFCEAWPPDRFPITFYRFPTCPDWRLSHDDFDWDEALAIPLLYLSATGLARSPSREVHLALAQRHAGRIVFDLDWRPDLWEEARDYPILVRSVCEHVHLVVGGEEEVRAAFAIPSRELALSSVGPSVEALIVKQGAGGARALTAESEIVAAAFPVEVVNGLGAGDAFAAALGFGLLNGLQVTDCLTLASAAGGIVAGQLSCSEAMPSREELLSFVEDHGAVEPDVGTRIRMEVGRV